MNRAENIRSIFTVYIGKEKISEIEIAHNANKKEYTFGRSKNNDIILSSPIVSNKHGIIKVDGDKCIVEVLSTTNGLYVNNEFFKSGEIVDGNTIVIGNIEKEDDTNVRIIYSKAYDEIEEKWETFELNKEECISIGRGKQATLSINHTTLSRLHAKICYIDGEYVLYDNNSTNGTYLNGRIVNGKAILKLNDVILMGNTKILFQEDKLLYNVVKKGFKLEAVQISKYVSDGSGIFKSNKKKILDNINITIKPGELIALIGGSGAGKTTFMDALNGFRLPTEGKVFINNDDFYENYNYYKSILGYVPQQDIVYDSLSVESMLMYAAKLRMPSDTTIDEMEERVKSVISDVELEGKENVIIKQLSGGQKKRVSIAVELLADPKLFYLDEPTSGLDPGMERNMMRLLRKLADKGKTIILITHATANINLCDKIVILGNGGKLCYFGMPKSALDFFDVEDYSDIYDLINNDSEKWKNEFVNSQYSGYLQPLKQKNFKQSNKKKKDSNGKKVSSFTQWMILSKRYINLITNDMARLMFLLVQPVIISLILGLVLNNDALSYYEDAKSVMFTLSCSAVWIGVLNSIQEVCKERGIYMRERAVNLRLIPYILSKVLILGVLCLIQSVLLVVVFSVFVKLPDSNLIVSTLFETIVTVFLTTLSSMAMGLAISTLVTNTDRAMGIAPIVLIPQLVFTGLVFKLEGVNSLISNFAVSKWASRALASSYDLNNIPLKMQAENLKLPDLPKDIPEYYDHVVSNLNNNWGVLIVITLVCIILSIYLLKRQDVK